MKRNLTSAGRYAEHRSNSFNPRSTLMIAGLLLVGFASAADASVVTMTADDAYSKNYTSFNATGKWDSGSAPTPGNDYYTGSYNMLTPDSTDSYSFAGDSLTVETGGQLTYNGYKGTNTITVNHLILDGGTLRNNPTNTTSNFYFAGSIEVTSSGGTIDTGSRGTQYSAADTKVTASITGSGALTLTGSGGGNIVLSNNSNTFTGDISVTNACVLVAPGLLNFDIGTSGVNNTISGTAAQAATFNGTFNIDLTNASSAPGDTWTLVNVATLTPTFVDGSFSIAGFTKTTIAPNQNLWTLGAYRFDESTGELSVVAAPEPASLALMAMGVVLFTRRRTV